MTHRKLREPMMDLRDRRRPVEGRIRPLIDSRSAFADSKLVDLDYHLLVPLLPSVSRTIRIASSGRLLGGGTISLRGDTSDREERSKGKTNLPVRRNGHQLLNLRSCSSGRDKGV